MATDVMMTGWADKSEAPEAAVSVWFKRPGMPVTKGDLLAELIVEKVNLELEAPEDGILLEILAEVGKTVEAGTVLARLGTTEEWAKISQPTPSLLATLAVGSPATTNGTAPAIVPTEVVASPMAKRLMREHEISLEEVAAFTGYKVRRIGEDEVKQYLESRRSADQTVPYAGLRRVIGERMSRSLHEMAQLTLTSEADVTELVAQRAGMAEKVSFTVLIARAVALSLLNHPNVNATFDGETIKLHPQANLTIAVDTERGLLAPVAKDAGGLSLSQLADEINRLSELARSGGLVVDDSANGSFSITNLGTFDIDMFTPVINPPQVAILGVGRIADRAGVVNGQLMPRKMMWLSLTFDHRVLDGAPAAAFLKEVMSRLEQPAGLFS